MGNDGLVLVSLRHLNSLESFCQRSYLIEFHQYRISCSYLDAFSKILDICNKQIISDKLDALIDALVTTDQAEKLRQSGEM